MKMSKKNLIELAKNLNAACIDGLTFEEANTLYKKILKKDVAFSQGAYGINSYLFEDKKTNKFYYISSRNANLFIFLWHLTFITSKY